MSDLLREIPPDLLPASWLGDNAAPLEVDLGCHKGLFLVEMAGQFPQRNFLGIELQTERVEGARRKIRARALTNAAVIKAEGLAALSALPDASVTFVHVLFPDPWPKRRHNCRRLVQAAFLEVACRILKPEGFLRLVTDDEDYALAMKEVVAKCSLLTASEPNDREYPATEFQKKFLTDQRPIHSLLLTRSGS